MPDSDKQVRAGSGRTGSGRTGLLELLARLQPIEEEFPPIEDPLPRPALIAEDEIEPFR